MKKTTESLVLPYRYVPRQYQQPFWNAMQAGKKRSVKVWHRRSGKDKTDLNFTISQMVQRVGLYYYFFPTYAQGKKILWDGIDRDGMAFMDHFPPVIVKNRNETDMKVTISNGSIFQIIGTDNYDSIVGTNPVGCVFSEYALQNPKVYDLVRPILRENGGWASFIFTPRGKNHAFKLYERARHNPDWFCELRTVRDTWREDGTPIISEADLESERREGMDEETLQQEYFCSFSGSLQGAYYAKVLNQAYDEGRVTRVPWEPILPVYTAWDLGIGDSTAIWFYQVTGREVRLIDCYSAQGEGLVHYAKVLRDKPYVYGQGSPHLAPHDIEVRELTTGKSRREAAIQLGLRFRTVPKWGIGEGIDAVRRLFSRCWFDAEKCEAGLSALAGYTKEYDERNQEFKKTPVHSWASHYADAFRVLAVGFREPGSQEPMQTRAESAFSPFSYEDDVPLRKGGAVGAAREFDIWQS